MKYSGFLLTLSFLYVLTSSFSFHSLSKVTESYSIKGSKKNENYSNREFWSNYEGWYGYDGLLDEIRDNDMEHLNGSVYLDYTGSALYRTSQINNIFELYRRNLFANPHSGSPASSMTTDLVESARDLVLNFLGTTSSKYTVIFTASATASLRLLAESFPWTEGSLYLYTRDNHNSVLGIRRWATHWGAKFKSVDENDIQDEEDGQANQNSQADFVSHLFAFPGEEKNIHLNGSTSSTTLILETDLQRRKENGMSCLMQPLICQRTNLISKNIQLILL